MWWLVQCLMYLYHYPDIWYDYATWHAQNGSPDAAAVVFQRALKALPGEISHLPSCQNLSFQILQPLCWQGLLSRTRSRDLADFNILLLLYEILVFYKLFKWFVEVNVIDPFPFFKMNVTIWRAKLWWPWQIQQCCTTHMLSLRKLVIIIRWVPNYCCYKSR